MTNRYQYNFIITSKITYCIVLFFSLLNSCKKKEGDPKVVTGIGTDNSIASAKVAGSIIDLGKGITEYGHCWSLNQSVDITEFHSSPGKATNTGTFISELHNLFLDHTYYLKAHIKTGDNIIYSELKIFNTSNLSSVNDIDGNSYDLRIIGTQIWMKENLKTNC